MNLDFSNIRVLLVGDLMIDYYIMGTSNRMSPEAPVPVVVPQEEYSIPGGAANVAMNLSAMGAGVTCLGTVGDDKWGFNLIEILGDNKIDTNGIEIIKNHPTTVKKRIYSDNKQVVRLDIEKKFDWKPKQNTLKKIKKKYDVIIISDYNKGVVEIKNSLIQDLKKYLKIEDELKNIFVDPKKVDFGVYRGANIITPNLNELQKATDISNLEEKTVIKACQKLINKFDFDYVISKKGSKGMTIFGKNNFIKDISANKVSNPDVTGAGDTVIAVLALAYCKTNDIEYAAKMANDAASSIVSKIGTVSIKKSEIKR
jgi:rfaE bifunctional protein kinase chain/domain